MYQKKERKRNQRQVLQVISHKRTFTVKDVAAQLGLSFPTAKSIIEEFSQEKIIETTEEKKKTQGRRAILYRFIPDSYYSLGIRIDFNSFEFVLLNLDLQILMRKRFEEDLVDPTHFKNLIEQELLKFLDKIDKEIRGRLVGLGIVVPIHVGLKKDSLEMGNFNLDLNYIKSLEEKINIPIFVQNEAAAATLAESILLKDEKPINNLGFISIDNIVSTGLVLDGQFYTGQNGYAGSIENLICSFNNLGEVEYVGSYIRINSLLNNFKQIYPDVVKLNDIFSKKYFETTEGSKIILAYINSLAIVIHNLIIALDTQLVIVGGILSDFRKYLEDMLYEHNIIQSLKRRGVEIIFSEYGRDAGLIGSGSLALATFLGFYDIEFYSGKEA